MMRTQEEQNILNQRTRNKDGQWRKKRSKNGDRRPSCSVAHNQQNLMVSGEKRDPKTVIEDHHVLLVVSRTRNMVRKDARVV